MSKMSEQTAIRIMNGNLVGTQQQESEAVKMSIGALEKIIEIKKFVKAKHIQKEITPELEDYLIHLFWDEL